MKIAVAGGTGLIGRHIVAAATEAGHRVSAISRATGVDLVGGSGLAAALDGCDVVIDVSNAAGISRQASVAFFPTATRQLLAAEAAVGIGHHVALSIVGIDRVPSGYYEGKRQQEAVIEAGEVPWTILRATQFHEFPEQLLAHAVGRVVPIPRMRTAPVAAREAADYLLDLATGEPRGHAPELSGPGQYQLTDLVRRVLAARHRRAWVLPLVGAGKAARAMADGGGLPRDGGRVGRQTFEQWLAGEVVHP